MDVTRIIDLPSKTYVEEGDYIAIDNQQDGTQKVQFTNLFDSSLSQSNKIAPANAVGQQFTNTNTEINALRAAVGTPLKATTASQMTDTNKIYVYVGSESGYINGNWYYYNGTTWVSGGVYNSIALETDKTLTVSDMAADAKVVGDDINDLKSTITYNNFKKYIADTNFTINEFVKVDGTFVYNASWYRTDYIECSGCKALRVRLNYVDGLVASIAFFDKNKNFIGYLETNTLSEMVFTSIPAEAYYVIFSSQIPGGGSRYAYIYRVNDTYSTNLVDKLANDYFTERLSFSHAEIITPTGAISANANYSRTDFVDLTNVRRCICRLGHNEYVANVAYYDEDKNFISYIEAPSDSHTFSIESNAFPSGARFAVFTTANAYVSSFVELLRSSFARQVGKIESGYYKADGTLTDSTDMSHISLKVSEKDQFHIVGCTYGGTIAFVTFFNQNTFVDKMYQGTVSTLVWRNIYFSIPSGVDEMRVSFANNCIDNGKLLIEKNVLKDNSLPKLYAKKVACLGDSITADDYCKIGTIMQNILGVYRTGNFAVGGATCADAINGSAIDLVHTNASQIGNSDVNVLSNQVRRLMARTTIKGNQITWTHPIDGVFSIPTADGTGVGVVEDVPDIVYIAIGVNDGGSRTGAVVDDTAEVLSQSYSELTRKSFASGLRWALETLRSAYPNAKVFVATPLWTGSSYQYAQDASQKLKSDIIKKVCAYCSVPVIDSQIESGFTKLDALSGTDSAYIHPDKKYRNNIAKYVANEIANRFVKQGTGPQNGIIN